jgi:RNA polymerase sigma-70 factor, ECF subfamily
MLDTMMPVRAHGTTTPPVVEALPDLLLIERARSGDARAIEMLMRRCNRRLYRVARSFLEDAAPAEMAVGDAYLAAFSDLGRYQPNGKFAAWLTSLVVEQTRHAVRRREPAAATGVTTGAGGAAVSDLERAVLALPEVFRAVFVLRVVEGIGGVETAASLGLNETTVRTRLYRAQRRLAAATGERVLNAPEVFALTPECAERIVQRVLAQLAA